MQRRSRRGARVVREIESRDATLDSFDDHSHGEDQDLGLAGEIVPDGSCRKVRLPSDGAHGSSLQPVASHDSPHGLGDLLPRSLPLSVLCGRDATAGPRGGVDIGQIQIEHIGQNVVPLGGRLDDPLMRPVGVDRRSTQPRSISTPLASRSWTCTTLLAGSWVAGRGEPLRSCCHSPACIGRCISPAPEPGSSNVTPAGCEKVSVPTVPAPGWLIGPSAAHRTEVLNWYSASGDNMATLGVPVRRWPEPVHCLARRRAR